MNCPIDPKTMEISGKKRIEESIPTIESLTDSKLVIASHQGRVGNTDYTSMAKHAAVLEEMLGRKIRYVEDTIGEAAQSAIRDLKDGEILMLDNLRLCAEENYEFLPEDAAKTIMVSRLWKLFDLCVLDSFPSAHRSHPSIVGFPNVIPACAGRIVEKEVRELDEILSVAKAPHVVVLGGSKVADRLEAISLLIKNGQADHILLTGVIASVFLRAQARIKYHLEIDREEELVRKAHALIGEYPDVFSTPVDIAIERNGKRVEIMVRELVAGDCILDMGPETVKHYEKIIFGAGTVFISGPAGFFENEQFSYGTEHLLKAVANSMATTSWRIHLNTICNTTCGAFATESISSSSRTSFSTMRPAHAGITFGNPTIDGCERCALGNESRTHKSNSFHNLLTIMVFAASSGKNS